MKQNIENEIRKIGALRYPNEACGFVVQVSEREIQVIEARNDSPEPQHMFLINPDQYLMAEDMGQIVGVWHTHTNGNTKPSQADLAGCEASNLTWYLCCVGKGTNDTFVYSPMVVFEPNGYEQDYLGRPYVFGTFDCWTLCRDFYRREFGIELKDYPRENDFWKKEDHNYFATKWQEVGLVEVQDGTYRHGDILFLQTDNSGGPNHSGIFLEGGQFMHHCVNRLSRRDTYGGYWLKHTVKHLRHKDNG